MEVSQGGRTLIARWQLYQGEDMRVRSRSMKVLVAGALLLLLIPSVLQGQGGRLVDTIQQGSEDRASGSLPAGEAPA